MNGLQCRMARAGLNWPARELARRADISVMTVARFEGGDTGPGSATAQMRRVFERAGVIFVDDDGAFPGVRIGDPDVVNKTSTR